MGRRYCTSIRAGIIGIACLAFGLKTNGSIVTTPSPRSKRFLDNDAVQFFDSSGKQDPNVRIRFNWLEKNLKKTKSPDERKYVFGSKHERECLLLNRVRE